MKIFIVNLFLYVLLCTCIISCSFESSTNQTKTLEVIGMNEVTLDDQLKTCLNINFNGNLEKKQELEKLMKSDELTGLEIELMNENYYKDGIYDNSETSKEFKYGMNYRVILNQESDKDLINKLLSENNIPVSINSNGYYLERTKNQIMQDFAFQKALQNANARIQAYADSLELDYEITSIEEIDDYQLFPIDNIVYQDKLIKKIKVKAILQPR